MHRIADDQRQRIGEDGRGLLERHAVLAMVRRGLARVPAESHTRKCMTLNDGDDKSRPSRIHGFAASSGFPRRLAGPALRDREPSAGPRGRPGYSGRDVRGCAGNRLAYHRIEQLGDL